MAESLKLADGTSLDVPKPEEAKPETEAKDYPAPPRREPKDPEAPYGRKADGSPKRGPGGRPPKSDRPRVATGPAGGTSGPPVDKAAIAQSTAETVVVLAAVLEMTGLGANSVALRADAVVLHSAAGPLGQAFAEVAAVNPFMARLLRTSGTASPWIGLMFTVYQVTEAIQANHRNPDLAYQIVHGAEAGSEAQESQPESDGPVHPEG